MSDVVIWFWARMQKEKRQFPDAIAKTSSSLDVFYLGIVQQAVVN